MLFEMILRFGLFYIFPRCYIHILAFIGQQNGYVAIYGPTDNIAISAMQAFSVVIKMIELNSML